MSLPDAQWVRIEPLLPDRIPKRGGRWRDHPEVIDAIALKFQTGTQWTHLLRTAGVVRPRSPQHRMPRNASEGRAQQHGDGAPPGSPGTP
ncbi:transposase [Streptomyces viridosporus]|uniref:transposase n=1 Tax=Streptomyces viridosporus TaxID=67581 RepID=UPI000D1CC497